MYLNIMDFFNFKNKIILITGSSGLIGKTICRAFLNCGAIVYGIDIKKCKLQNKRYFHKKINLKDNRKISKYINNLIAKNKKIDVIINAAAVSFFSHFEKRKISELQKTIDVNLVGTMNVIKNYVIIHKKKKA